MTRLNRFINSCDLPSQTVIGEGTVFMHNGLGCVINEFSIIGKDCVIYQNVTLAGKDKQRPHIGDGVMIGAGAVLIGGVSIGDRATIGANAVVTHDIPEGKTAVGIPARVIE
jgi:serine O-acetyltransferase